MDEFRLCFVGGFVLTKERRRTKGACCLLDVLASRAAENRQLKVGDVVCPRHLQTSGELFRKGIYRHVSYQVEAIQVEEAEGSMTKLSLVPEGTDPANVFLHLRPATRILPRFERNWPVVVSIKEGCIVSFWDDILITSASYVQLSLCVVIAAFVLRNVFSIAYVPSESMVPTLNRGDAVLVQYLSSRIGNVGCRRDDIVFFSPPEELREYVRRVGNTELRTRDLFVKRIVGCPGDLVHIDARGSVEINGNRVGSRATSDGAEGTRAFAEQHMKLSDDEVFVLGDNPGRSVDSRFWGPLKMQNIVARPIVRLWNTLKHSVRVEELK
ncbi:hypothetical protein NDN08_006353 [Rhodosorus marinus]|uniref:Mitochondrial inner membrane protease subunit n=1 Tax=Rhodosorus marinus TaxID=101924 RepID=A0AAV8UPM2_9RHOD|nr:hypothetical protein NDN08_006353 [Rhodosorus marinus]